MLAEVALSAVIPDLSSDEQQVYQLDQIMNERGFQLDQEAVRCALRLLAVEQGLLRWVHWELIPTQEKYRSGLSAWVALIASKAI